jgi:hypothetical protein
MADPEQRQGLDFDVYLAPMLVQELAPAAPAAARPDRFGAVIRDASGRLAVDPERPTVYYRRDEAALADRSRPRLAFLWCYGGGAAGKEGFAVQGVRWTLGRDGLPAIFEVLAARSEARRLYASESLERASRAHFGEPLPGRRLAVEGEAREPPAAEFAGLVEDGPAPMGAFVYLEAGTREIVNLLCRCDRTRFQTLESDGRFRLAPLEELAALGIEDPEWSEEILTRSPPEPPVSAAWLESVLRLPPEF